jgi:tetratricopeptide (TPR) repeat protein
MLEGDGPGAERHFLRALRIHPDSPQDLYNYAELLRTLLDDPVRARRYYARFAEVAPPKLDRERRAALDHLGR